MSEGDQDQRNQIRTDAVEEGRDPRTRLALVVLGVIFLVSLLGGAVAGVLAYQDLTRGQQSAIEDASEARQIAEQNRTTANQNKRAARELAEQVEKLGGNPVVDPENLDGAQQIPGPEGPAGTPGPPPTTEQIAAAVDFYCSVGRCQGRDGADATPGQVAQAVSLYCNSRGQCLGPQGIQGVQGDPGVEGDPGAVGSTGPQGPPPSGEQVASAVEAYCSGGRCVGERGPVGPTGVVDVEVIGCDPFVGKTTLSAMYDEPTQTIIITCSAAQ